ncbi:MAG: class I SAM-dependent methyltransferase [Pseudomonadota bacterium]
MGDKGGCLPGAPPEVDAQLTRLWAEFAHQFGGGAKLVDLACGAGAVMRSLLRGNDGLDLVGVDYAELPKSRSKRITLIGSTDIASLPFEDGHFDGLTSQFGIEYADLATAGPEMARVAKPGARLQFVVHHAESPVVEQNRNRHAALCAIARSSILDMARTAAAQPGSDTALLRQAFSLVARSHPDQAVVREIAAGIDNAIRIGGKKGNTEFDRISANLTRECEVLAALLDAALDEDGIAEFAGTLSRGFVCRPVKPLKLRGLANPIAWLVSAARKD